MTVAMLYSQQVQTNDNVEKSYKQTDRQRGREGEGEGEKEKERNMTSY